LVTGNVNILSGVTVPGRVIANGNIQNNGGTVNGALISLNNNVYVKGPSTITVPLPLDSGAPYDPNSALTVSLSVTDANHLLFLFNPNNVDVLGGRFTVVFGTADQNAPPPADCQPIFQAP